MTRENITSWNLNDKIHPDLAEAFAVMPEVAINAETLNDVRKTFMPPVMPTHEHVKAYDDFTPSGLRVRMYVPDTGAEVYPGLLWIHGGGHIAGVPEQDEELVLEIAHTAGTQAYHCTRLRTIESGTGITLLMRGGCTLTGKRRMVMRRLHLRRICLGCLLRILWWASLVRSGMRR